MIYPTLRVSTAPAMHLRTAAYLFMTEDLSSTPAFSGATFAASTGMTFLNGSLSSFPSLSPIPRPLGKKRYWLIP